MSDQCILCGAPLAYLDSAEEMTCEICGQKYLSNARCTNGHFVCDGCHASPAEACIQAVAAHTDSTNPVAIAQTMMQHPSVNLHGPEHHMIVGAALYAAYRNAGGVVNETTLPAILSRGKKVPGGFCGMAGCCGAAVSAGIFYSVITKTTPLSTKSWGDATKMTAACLNAVAEFGGPRCCKRDSLVSITTAAAFLEKELSVSLLIPKEIVCHFSSKNAECLQTRCPFYRK